MEKKFNTKKIWEPVMIEDIIKDLNLINADAIKVRAWYKDLTESSQVSWLGGKPVRGVLFMNRTNIPIAMRIFYNNVVGQIDCKLISVFTGESVADKHIHFEYVVTTRIDNIEKIRISKEAPLNACVFDFGKTPEIVMAKA